MKLTDLFLDLAQFEDQTKQYKLPSKLKLSEGFLSYDDFLELTSEDLEEFDKDRKRQQEENQIIRQANERKWYKLKEQLVEMLEDAGVEVYKNKKHDTMYAHYQKMFDDLRATTSLGRHPSFDRKVPVIYIDADGKKYFYKTSSTFGNWKDWRNDIASQHNMRMNNERFYMREVEHCIIRAMAEGKSMGQFDTFDEFKAYCHELFLQDSIKEQYPKNEVKVTRHDGHECEVIRGEPTCGCGSHLVTYRVTGGSNTWPSVVETLVPMHDLSDPQSAFQSRHLLEDAYLAHPLLTQSDQTWWKKRITAMRQAREYVMLSTQTEKS